MKALALRLSAIGAMVLSFSLWMYGGARAGFHKDFYVVQGYDEIMEMSFPVEVPAFLPGIETLLGGFVIFVVLLAAGAFLESKEPSL